MVVAEYRRRREQCSQPSSLIARGNVPAVQQNAQFAGIRGYESPEVFRADALTRIQQLEEEIAKDIGQVSK